MLPLSGHLERAGLGCDSKRVDYGGQFLAGNINGWCNVTGLSGNCIQMCYLQQLLRKVETQTGWKGFLSWSFCCFCKSLHTLWWIFLIRGELEQCETVFCCEEFRVERRERGVVVVVFSCMLSDPKTQVQASCSPPWLPTPAAKWLSIWSSFKSWLSWICLPPTVICRDEGLLTVF